MSAKAQSLRTENFYSQLALYRKQQFTGRLDIRAATGQEWHLYLSLGFLVWAAGGVHPIRRWRRQLFRCGHQAYSGQVVLRETDEFECWDYHALTLLSQRQTLAEKQIVTIIQGVILEVLFDIVQGIANLDLDDPDRCTITPRIGARPSSSHTNILRRKWTLAIAPTFKQAESQWQKWVGLDLARYLPDWVPAIADSQLLKQNASPPDYQKLSALMNGRSPLRDLAVIAKQDLFSLAQFLAPYLCQNLLEIREVPDLSNRYVTQYQETRSSPPMPMNSSPPAKHGIIACIDDHPDICEALEDCLNPAGYQVLVFQDAVYALSLVLKHKPDLIFLNLVMPIVSGYELCAQIRRIPDLQATPIIAIAGKGAIVDRVRGKFAGATDFLLQPIEGETVVAIAQKYLPERQL